MPPAEEAGGGPVEGSSATGPPRPLILFTHKGRDWIRGSERCLLDLVAGLERERFELLVVANGRMLLSQIERMGVETMRIAHWGGGPVAGGPWRLAMRRLLQSRRPSLVHANMAVTLPLVSAAAEALGIPVVTHLHVPYQSLAERHRSLVRRSAVVVGVAEHVVAPLRDDAATRDRVRVIGNAVDAERLDRGGGRLDRALLGVGPGAIVATALGSLIERKGHDVVIRALAHARELGADLHLLLCGDGEELARLRSSAVTLGVGEFVHFLGARSDAGAILRDATDMLVTGAREEAMPLSVLEAQWLGVPVVASDIAAHREVLDGDRGLLVPSDDSRALGAAMAALGADGARRAALGGAGRRHARAAYTMARYVAEFTALYDDCIARRIGRRGHSAA